MAKFYTLLMSMLTLGVAHAQEEMAQQPVVLPEPNYWAIGIFFLIVIASCGWYCYKLFTQKEGDQK